jgi:EmrB/QacA subfamily drug resistance transporter
VTRARRPTTARRTRSGPDADTAYAWRVFSATAPGIGLAGLNTSTMDTALSSVARHFDASPPQATWILLSYLVVNTAFILVLGRVSDMVGRRGVYLLGLATFAVAGLACGLAPSAGWLIALRAVQAVGAAAMITNVIALLADVFPARALSTALGLNTMVVSTTQLVGPVVGGAMVETFGWRAAFWFNVPVAVVSLVWAARILRRPPKRAHPRERFDLAGAVLSTTALASLVLALSFGGTKGWTSPLVVTAGIGFIMLLSAFLFVERRPHPLLDLRLLADREKSLAYLATFLMAASRMAVVLLIAVYLQAASSRDALEAGLHVTPAALGMAASSIFAGRLTRRFGARVLASTGIVMTMAGLIVIALCIDPDFTGAPLAGCLLLIGMGSGLFLTPNTTAIMLSVRPGQRGVANGLRSALQNTGFVLGTAGALAIVTGWLTDDEKRAAYAGTLSRMSDDNLGGLTTGYRVAFAVMAFVCLLALVASLLRSPPPSGRDGAVASPAREAVR